MRVIKKDESLFFTQILHFELSDVMHIFTVLNMACQERINPFNFKDTCLSEDSKTKLSMLLFLLAQLKAVSCAIPIDVV